MKEGLSVIGKRDSVGCLFIGDALGRKGNAGPSWARDIPGVELRAFRCADARGLWDRLQCALQALRSERGFCPIMAVGTGCAAALALACQLPVEKLVLIDPARPARPFAATERAAGGDDARAQKALRRLAGFARRNLPLCVSDMLIVDQGSTEGEDALRRAYGSPVNCRTRRLSISGGWDKDLYTIREFEVKEAISRFLQPADARKPLAENSEMCIIYG